MTIKRIFALLIVALSFLLQTPEHGFAFQVSVSSSENIYVTGWASHCTQGWVNYVVEYDSECNPSWTTSFPFAVQPKISEFKPFSQGGVVTKNHKFQALQFDLMGNILWNTEISEEDGYSKYATDFTVDNDGNVFLAGDYNVYQQTGDVHYDLTVGPLVVVKYDSSGEMKWEWQYQYDDWSHDEARNITIAENNQLFFTGVVQEDNPLELTTFYWNIFSLSPEGQLLWKSEEESGEDRDLVLDNSGNPIVLAIDYDLHTCKIVKYNADGKFIFETELESSQHSLAVDSQNNIVVTGADSWVGDDYWIEYIHITHLHRNGIQYWRDEIQFDDKGYRHGGPFAIALDSRLRYRKAIGE